MPRAASSPVTRATRLQHSAAGTTFMTATARTKRMGWVIFVAGAVLSWGAYGALLHLGQTQLGNPLKALLCVGVAYFLIGVLHPGRRLELAGRAVRVRNPGADQRDGRGGAGRCRRGLHHLGVQDRRTAGVRHAARLWRRADRQRRGLDGDPSAESGAQPDAVRRLPAGLDRRRDGVVLRPTA